MLQVPLHLWCSNLGAVLVWWFVFLVRSPHISQTDLTFRDSYGVGAKTVHLSGTVGSLILMLDFKGVLRKRRRGAELVLFGSACAGSERTVRRLRSLGPQEPVAYRQLTGVAQMAADCSKVRRAFGEDGLRCAHARRQVGVLDEGAPAGSPIVVKTCRLSTQ